MYKKMTAALLLAASITGSAGMLNPLFAQEQPQAKPEKPFVPKQFLLNIVLPCDTKEAMAKLLEEKYIERPYTISMGHMTVVGPGGSQKLPGIVKIWSNPETMSFSVTIEDPTPQNDVMCMLTNGTNLRPAPGFSGGGL